MSISRNSYHLKVEPFGALITAHYRDAVLAKSKAVKVLHETRLSPVFYFPENDVRHDFLRQSNHRTFCPFKGTAKYWDIILPDATVVENGAWSYERSLPEGKAIEGYIGFISGVIDLYETSLPLPQKSEDGHLSGPLIDWLIGHAWKATGPSELTYQLCQQLLANGIPICRMAVVLWAIDPRRAGIRMVWTRDWNSVEYHITPHDVAQRRAYINSPIRHVSEGLGGVRQLLTKEAVEFDFPIMRELKEKGVTDYVAMPLPFSDGRVNVLTIGSDDLQGFTTADLGLIFECAPIISRFYEVLTLRSNTVALLDAYLGRRTGARVLDGHIRRGEGEDIEAAILYCDLRRSSILGANMPRKEYLKLLNIFFESVVEPILGHGGEVLKFIGDAVLAIFPVDHSDQVACEAARLAALEIINAVQAIAHPSLTAPLECVIGLHFGRVTYGNVGAKKRLDFTVVGMAANLAARLTELGKENNWSLVVSKDFCRRQSAAYYLLGTYQLRHIDDNAEVYSFR